MKRDNLERNGGDPKRRFLRSVFRLLVLATLGVEFTPAQQGPSDVDLVTHVLATELNSVQDKQHPMRYRLRKSSPRITTTKEIFETKDGAVARLIDLNDKPLGPEDEEKEQARLSGLLNDPSRQQHRKQAEDDDMRRALKVMRALPNAFIYQFSGEGLGPTGNMKRFTFKPNANFDPPDLETQALSAMAGEIWIDVAQERVVRLEGHLQQDVDFGWGILGRLDKGGWIVIEQADVGNHQWRIVRFQMVMNGRVLLKTKSFDTTEDESKFVPVPLGLGYAQAIQTLQGESGKVE
jgi:hypothetical protein